MFFRSSIQKKAMNRVPWDICDSRGDQHLLVWGNIPHWMVADGEMMGFLERLDGKRSLKEIVETVGGSSKELAKIVKSLEGVGVIRLADQTGILERKPKGQTLIENISINLTSRCNLKCAFCYARGDGARRGGDEISFRDVQRLLNDTKPYRSKDCSLVILGGEPYFEPEKLHQIAELAKTERMTTIVSTNGTLIDEKQATRARDAGMQVQVSLDGADAQSHEEVRGKGMFERVVNGIRALTMGGVYTVVSMVCHEGNLGQLEAFFELAKSLHVREARFIPLKRIGAGRSFGHRPVKMSRLMSSAYEMFRKRPDFLPLMGRDALSILGNTCRYSFRRPSCGTGSQTLLLDSDGALYPCLNLNHPRFKIASIHDLDYDFKKAWFGTRGLEVMRNAVSVENPERVCSRCPVRYWCLGGCRGEAFAESGDAGAPSPDCADLKRTMLDMMWMLTESPGLIKPVLKIC